MAVKRGLESSSKEQTARSKKSAKVRSSARRSRTRVDTLVFAETGPGSLSWKINREAVLLLGGSRALLMQGAHPLIAAAGRDHSAFKTEPEARLRRTIESMYTITFGTPEEAKATLKRIEAMHARVRGVLGMKSKKFGADTPYSALDPDLLLWVHATLVDTTFLVYQRFVRQLTADERERYYQSSKLGALMFGVPLEKVPPDLGCFEAYMHEMLHHGPLEVTPVARELAQILLYRKYPVGYAWIGPLVRLITAGLLPPSLRSAYGIAWDGTREMAFELVSMLIRTILPFLPDRIRVVAKAREAERRILREGLGLAVATSTA